MAEARVAGFWIRVLADSLDALILGAVGFALASVFRGPLLALGERAVFIGAAISLVYSGVLQSQIGGGRTLAKRLLGLRVVRLDGQYLSLDRSLVRWSTMGVLCYGGAVAYALSAIVPALDVTTLFAAFGGAQFALFLGCVLVVPFHPLKRGLHDLLTGSIVLRNGKHPVELITRRNSPTRDRRLVVAGIVVALLGTVGGMYFWNNVPSGTAESAKVMRAMTAMGIQNPTVIKFGPTRAGAQGIGVMGYLPTNADGSPRIENAEDRILAAIRREMAIGADDTILINLRTGINLGIFRSYEAKNRIEGKAAQMPEGGIPAISPL
jgi:uncharacterized RDD family membrane protein YckC